MWCLTDGKCCIESSILSKKANLACKISLLTCSLSSIKFVQYSSAYILMHEVLQFLITPADFLIRAALFLLAKDIF